MARAHEKSAPFALDGRRRLYCIAWEPSFIALAAPLQNPAAATVLISFLKALPDCRMCRGIRYPQWWMLLDRVEIEGLLVQADVLHANRPFRRPRAAWRRQTS